MSQQEEPTPVISLARPTAKQDILSLIATPIPCPITLEGLVLGCEEGYVIDPTYIEHVSSNDHHHAKEVIADRIEAIFADMAEMRSDSTFTSWSLGLTFLTATPTNYREKLIKLGCHQWHTASMDTTQKR